MSTTRRARGGKGHTLVSGCLNMTQHEALLPTKIFGSEASTVSTRLHVRLATYALISFFATARNGTVP
jgi:hypothetical protein